MPIANSGLLTRDEAMMLVGQSKREWTRTSDSGVIIDDFADSNAIRLAHEVVDPINIRESFLGLIVDEGPEDDKGEPQEDFEDSRYWVKEVVHATPPDTPIIDAMGLAILANEYPDPNDPPAIGRPIRYVVATNLSERQISLGKEEPGRHRDVPEEPADETHALAAETCVIVRVFLMYDLDRLPRWYFFRTPISGLDFCVLRFIPEETGEEGNRIMASPLSHSDTDPWDNEYVIDNEIDNQFEVVCWPRTKAKNYKPFLQPTGSELHLQTIPQPISLIQGVWHVMQHPRYAFPVQGLPIAVMGCLPKVEA